MPKAPRAMGKDESWSPYMRPKDKLHFGALPDPVHADSTPLQTLESENYLSSEPTLAQNVIGSKNEGFIIQPKSIYAEEE